MPNHRPRVALYSHDTMGLGHTRRNHLIAQTLAASRQRPVILSIVGRSEARRFPLPPGADRLVLPALCKTGPGQYEARSLGVELRDIVRLRSQVIAAALDAFSPDLFIVDNVPRGAVRELDDALELAAALGTRTVLGLRDVLDEPEVVAREWRENHSLEAIRRLYDQVWIYGDPRVYDALREYHMPPDIAAKMRYTGYFDQRARLHYATKEDFSLLDDLALPPGSLALCLLGGGEDGGAVAKAFAEATVPADCNRVIVTGPYVPDDVASELRRRAESDARFRVLDFIAEPATLLARADRVVAMGGYNTVWEIVSFAKPALIVPRMKPRREQCIRAQRLEALGLLEVLPPDRLSAEAIGDWLSRDVRRPAPVHQIIDLGGLQRLPHLAAELLARSSTTQERARWVKQPPSSRPGLGLVTSSSATRATPRPL